MSAFELTSAGLTIQSVREIQDEIGAKMRADVDPLINTSPDSPDGNEIGVYASQEREVQEAVQEAYDTIDPDNAEGLRLETIGALRGIPKNPAVKSKFIGSRKIKLTVGAGKVITAGVIASVVNSPRTRFVTLDTADNSAGLSSADILVRAECEITGPVHANAGTLTVIATPADGWLAVINEFDPILGSNVETDTAYLQRQENELQQGGECTTEGIRTALLTYKDETGAAPIISCKVYENDTDSIDANGLYPHTFEAVLWDAGAVANDVIAGIIYTNKPAGIRPGGLTSVVVTDSEGDTHGVGFTRATDLDLKIGATYTYDASTYVGNDAVKQALVDAVQGKSTIPGTGQRVALKVHWSAYAAVVQSMKGVRGLSDFTLAFGAGSPVSFADLSPGIREIALTSTGSITIASTEGP